MIIQCQSCASKYFLPEEKVPVNPLKVRCPKCCAVFMLTSARERVAVAAESPAALRRTRPPEPAVMEAPAPPVAPVEVEPPVARIPRAPVAQAPVTESAPAASVEPVQAPEASPAPAPAAEPARSSRGGKSAEDRAKRLARVLVSDILWYNRDRRDAALRDGTLMTSLGEEIKKSWELYKEKVGPEAAHSTNYFKEALNEILADGQQVF